MGLCNISSSCNIANNYTDQLFLSDPSTRWSNILNLIADVDKDDKIDKDNGGKTIKNLVKFTIFE